MMIDTEDDSNVTHNALHSPSQSDLIDLIHSVHVSLSNCMASKHWSGPMVLLFIEDMHHEACNVDRID